MLSYHQSGPPTGHKRKRSLASDRDTDAEHSGNHHPSHLQNDHDLIETTLHDQPWTFLACRDQNCSGGRFAHSDALVVSTKGACKCNGRPWADGAVGVFFHHNADGWNQSMRLPTDMVHTNHRAELFAGILALRLVAEIRARNPSGRKRTQHACAGPLRRLRRVIIKTDSAYMAQDMTEWMHNWQQYGWANQLRANIGNADLFRQLEDLVMQLSERGVQVQFAYVPESENGSAGRLAKAALEDLAATEAVNRFASYYSDQESDDSPMML
nr:ribonuclease h [Quercus suber]